MGTGESSGRPTPRAIGVEGVARMEITEVRVALREGSERVVTDVGGPSGHTWSAHHEVQITGREGQRELDLRRSDGLRRGR